MRWFDKPRKKTSREIVLEYVKFLKITGYFHLAVKMMYLYSRRYMGASYAPIYKDHSFTYCSTKNLSHNRSMIMFIESMLCRHTRMYKSVSIALVDFLRLRYSESIELKELLWLYFEEKHIANCIINP
jgi:hypothetical protein